MVARSSKPTKLLFLDKKVRNMRMIYPKNIDLSIIKNPAVKTTGFILEFPIVYN